MVFVPESHFFPSQILAIVKQSRLLQKLTTSEPQHVDVLKLLIIAQKQAESLCQEIRIEIAEHDRTGQLLKQEAANRRKARNEGESLTADQNDNGKGKGKAKDDFDDFMSDDETDDGLPKTPAGQEHAHKKHALLNRLRETLIVVHQVHFLLGDVYHLLGESYSTSEDAEYAVAENIRKELLKSVCFISAVID